MAKQYAGFWIRFVAAIIDGLVLMIPIWLLMMVFLMPLFMGAAFLSAGEPDPFWVLQFITAIVFFAVIATAGQWLYEALMTSSPWQATLGKRAVGIIVTDERGKRLTFARATGRHFAKYLSQMVFMVGYVMAAFTERKRALHDMVAGTLVVKK